MLKCYCRLDSLIFFSEQKKYSKIKVNTLGTESANTPVGNSAYVLPRQTLQEKVNKKISHIKHKYF